MEEEREGMVVGEDGRKRCLCKGELKDYIEYKDNEWGVNVEDDLRIFEKICIEGLK